MAPSSLLLDCLANEWAFDLVLACLASEDILWLTITALEYGDDRFLELTHWLMDSDSLNAKHNDHELLIEAAKLGYWKAGARLSLRVVRAMVCANEWISQHVGVLSGANLAVRLTMAAINTMEYPLRREVLMLAAARGDLIAVASTLLRRGHDHQAARDAFRAAADARQYRVVSWVAFQARICDECCGGDVGTVHAEIARNGDLALLQDRYTREDHNEWDINAMIEGAAARGHVAVVEWILQTFRTRNVWYQQLEVVQRLLARLDVQNLQLCTLMSAAKHGRLDVVRWFKQNLDESTWRKFRRSVLQSAEQAGELEVIGFLHKEDSFPLSVLHLRNMKESTRAEAVAYFIGRTNVNTIELLCIAAQQSNLEVVKYRVLERGYWSRQAFAHAVNRSPTARPGCSGLEIGQFLYAHAKEHAHMPLEGVIDFSMIQILKILCYRDCSTARWLAECVPEVDTRARLRGSSSYNVADVPRSSEAQQAILSCLRARPAQCLELGWLPQWACNSMNFEVFSMLVDMGHPHATEHVIVSSITHEWRDLRFLLKPLAAKDVGADALARIVPRVAGLGDEGVLVDMYSRWGEEMRASKRRWQTEAALEAVQHGRTRVLQWLHDRTLLVPTVGDHDENDDPESLVVGRLVEQAAKHDRVECLQWLVKTVDVSAEDIAKALRVAIAL